MIYFSVNEADHHVPLPQWFTPDLLAPEHKQYFSIEYDSGQRQWVLSPRNYIGIIPLTAEYGVQIRPKSGLANFTYMLNRSGLLNRSLETPFDQTVPYAIPEDDIDSFFEGIILSFLQSLDEIKRWGLLRDDAQIAVESNIIKGRIDHPRWLRRSARYGLLMPPVPQWQSVSRYDNIPNRVLRTCLDYLAETPLQHIPKQDVLERLSYFGQVQSDGVLQHELTILERMIESGRLPSNRYYYLPALNLALLIFRGAGLTLDEPQDVVFKPIVINTAIMFERYVRTVYQDAVTAYDAYAEDGRTNPIDFYNRSARKITIQPDIVVRRGGRTLMVVDVKYKFEPTTQDHYQMWAYLHGHDVKQGGFVSVTAPNVLRSERVRQYERNDYLISDFSFDSKNIRYSEEALHHLIVQQMESSLAK